MKLSRAVDKLFSLVKHLALVYLSHSGILDHKLIVLLQSVEVAWLDFCPQARRVRRQL